MTRSPESTQNDRPIPPDRLGHTENSGRSPRFNSGARTRVQLPTGSTRSTEAINAMRAQTAANGSMFQSAQHVNISGGNFSINQNSSNNDIFLHATRMMGLSGRLEKAIEVLRSSVAPGATYDCAERSDVPKCHPETREAIIANIMRWVGRSDNRQRFLWMYGPAGCGKTTIAGTIADICDNEGLLAASFFFSRVAGSSRPTENKHFVATIVDQMCIAIPEMRHYVAKAIDHDPRIFSKTLSKQMDGLLIEPLNKVSARRDVRNAEATRPRLVIVDGLDECEGVQSQLEVLKGLEAAATRLLYPMVFLISSRPEHSIRSTFASESMSSLTQGMPLDNNYQADADIRKFLTSRFELIRKKHPGAPYLPANWPSSEDLQYLIGKSSGQFIYPSVVMNWVESTHHSPVLRLEEILKLSSLGNSNPMPFEQLDMVYSHVLSTLDPDNLAKALEIICWMILDSDVGKNKSLHLPTLFPGPPLSESGAKTLEEVDRLFSYHPGMTRIVMTGLSALINIPEIRPNSAPGSIITSTVGTASMSGSLFENASMFEEIRNSPFTVEYSTENTSSSDDHLDPAFKVGFPSGDMSISQKFHNEGSAIGVPKYSPCNMNHRAFASQTTSSEIRFFHASFPDFLMDRSRSGKYFIDILSAHHNLAIHWMKYYSKYIVDPPRSAKELDDIGLNGLDVTWAIFSHCTGTTMTPELQDDLYTLDLRPVLSICDPMKYWWHQAFLILNFCLWLKKQILPDPQKDLYSYYFQHAVKSIQAYWLTCPLQARSHLPISLTFPGSMNEILQFKCILDLFIRPGDKDYDFLQELAVVDAFSAPLLATNDVARRIELFSATKTLLCQILTNFELSMIGIYFDDSRTYTQLADFLVQSYFSNCVNTWKIAPQGKIPHNFGYLAIILPWYLTKASPDANLAMILRDKGLQLHMTALMVHLSVLKEEEQGSELLRAFTLANLIYVKQSGIQFREHTHCPEFDPEEWYCAICATEYSEDELSLDPVPEPQADVVLPAEQGFIRRHLMAHFVPLLAMIRIGVWIAWLTEMLQRMLIIR